MGAAASLSGLEGVEITKEECLHLSKAAFKNGNKAATLSDCNTVITTYREKKAEKLPTAAAASGGGGGGGGGDVYVVMGLDEIESKRQMHPLNLARTERLRSMFKDIDSDNSKDLDWDEFKSCLVTSKFSEEKAKKIFDEIDKMNPARNSGKISNNKFDYWNICKTIELMNGVFQDIDTNGDRQISQVEFTAYFRKNKVNKSKTVNALWEDMDTNHNEKVNLKEWKAWSEQIIALDSLEHIFDKSGVDK